MHLRGLALGWILLLGAWQAWAHGSLHEQIQRLTQELEAHPDRRDLLIERGTLYRVHELHSEALLDWEKAARLDPKDATNDFRLGIAALALRQTNAAVERLERFAAQVPGSIPGQLEAARACRLAGRHGDAVRYWTTAIRKAAEPRPEWFLDRARSAERAGIPPIEVLAGLDEGIARYGPLPPLQLKAVEIEVGRGAIDSALHRLSESASRAERKERWLLRRAEVLAGAGRSDEARTEFLAARAAIEQLPERIRKGWAASELTRKIDDGLAKPPPKQDPSTPTP
jgi:tetratricopeptide (TPR) repeat protein